MAKSTPKLTVKKPQNFLTKPLTADFKSLFKALAKSVTHGAIGKWEEVGNDTAEAISALGLATEPGELGFLLLQRALIKALVELVGESASPILSETTVDADALVDGLDLSTSEVYIDKKFFDRPSELPLITELKSVLKK